MSARSPNRRSQESGRNHLFKQLSVRPFLTFLTDFMSESMKNHKILMLGSTVMVLLAIAVAPVQAQFELRLGGISLEQVGPPPQKSICCRPLSGGAGTQALRFM